MSKPAWLKSLKKYGETTWDSEKTTKTIHDENDRGAIILSGSMVEEFLELSLIGKMEVLQNDGAARTAMFGYNGVAGTFSSKIALAYALSIIDKRTQNEINIIREMRNTCAHSPNTVTLTDEPLRAAAELFLSDEIDALKDREPDTLKMAIVMKCFVMARWMAKGSRDTLLQEELAAVYEDQETFDKNELPEWLKAKMPL